MQIPEWMTTMRQQVDSWAQQQRAALRVRPQITGWPPWYWQLKLPWHEDKKRKEELQEEYRKRKEQIESLCAALKVDNLAELQDVLGAMVLAECVYKRPDSEVVRHVNIFKSDFGGQLVSLNRVQPSLDHVPHRYCLAEGGDTLFAAFSGTKHIKDYLTDANILQEALFHEEDIIDNTQEELEGSDGKVPGSGTLKPSGGSKDLPSISTVKGKPGGRKPSVHRGFFARARGIPAEDIYRLAQKKNYKLVLCGHSLGGAVAVLATLAILKAFATPSVMKAGGKLQIKCITFSQPPVGNPGLRDYVHRKGWQQHFRSYCIPEDLVPRLLSPGYFQHYRVPVAVAAEVPPSDKEQENVAEIQAASPENPKVIDNDRMVLGLGPFPKHIWRLPKLVPLVGTPRRFQWLKKRRGEQEEACGGQESSSDSNAEVTPMEIEESTDGAVLVTPESETKLEPLVETEKPVVASLTKDGKSGNPASWLTTRVPPMPSYVPFGELFLLERSAVEQLSASEFTQLTSVQTVVQELLDRFQSHTMRSYRQRFKRIYDSCMTGYSPTMGMDHLLHLPNFQQWFGVLGARVAELGSIFEPIIVRTATALVPLGWTGLPGEKGSNPLIIDVQGYNLHHCSHVRAQVNGRWCSAIVESKPTSPYSKQDLQQVQPKLQKMRVRIGPPVDKAPQKSNLSSESAGVEGSKGFNNNESFSGTLDLLNIGRKEFNRNEVQGFGEVTLYCSTDFMSLSQDVIARMRRVRLLGLEGAGKTSLYCALLGDEGRTLSSSDGGVLPDMDWREGVAGGVSYVDAAGVNLQDLSNEAENLRRELSVNVGQYGKKLDLVILVHNLGHKIPQLHHVGEVTTPRPALSLLLDEVHAAGVPLILAITNKFAVSADRRFVAARTVMNTYHVPSKYSVVVNSCPHTVHGVASETLESLISQEEAAMNGPTQPKAQSAAQRLLSGPMNLVPRPFRKREVVLPSEGVQKLTSLVHDVLSSKEEAAYQELAKEQLALKTTEELVHAARENAKLAGQRTGPAAAAAVGAAFGAGLGVFVAIVVGAANALRKP